MVKTGLFIFDWCDGFGETSFHIWDTPLHQRRRRLAVSASAGSVGGNWRRRKRLSHRGDRNTFLIPFLPSVGSARKFIFFLFFLYASSPLYKRSCPSVRQPSVGPSVCRSVRPVLFSKVKSTHTRRILCRVSGLVTFLYSSWFSSSF